MTHLLNLFVLVGLLTGAALAETGHLEIKLISASFISVEPEARVMGYIQNSTQFVHFPILTGLSKVVSFYGPSSSRSQTPVWNSICEGFSNKIFSDQAQIIFEVWDDKKDDQRILYNAKLTIKDLLAQGKNRHEIVLPLKRLDELVHGSFKAIVAWNPGP